MAVKTIEFSKAAGYRADVATGAIISGPTRDGMVHMSFFRDVQLPKSWDAEVESVGMPGGSGMRVKDSGQPTVDFGRELVATIVLPVSAAERLQGSLKSLADFVNSTASAEKK